MNYVGIQDFLSQLDSCHHRCEGSATRIVLVFLQVEDRFVVTVVVDFLHLDPAVEDARELRD